MRCFQRRRQKVANYYDCKSSVNMKYSGPAYQSFFVNLLVYLRYTNYLRCGNCTGINDTH